MAEVSDASLLFRVASDKNVPVEYQVKREADGFTTDPLLFVVKTHQLKLCGV